MFEFTRAEAETRERSEAIFSALTVEFALYAALAFAALLLRLFALDASPLNSDETRQAVASWNFVRGISNAVTGSPLLFTFNSILFALFGASDFTARLAPAFFGTALVLLPALFRRDLGRAGALIASALLTLSPSLVFFSRTLDGAIPAVTCALATIAFAARYLETRAARDLHWAAAGAALALVTAPDVWTIALALVLWALALHFGLVPRFDDRKSEIGNQKSSAVIVFVLVFLGFSTTFFLHREGIGAAFDLFAAWLDRLRFGGSLVEVLRLLVVYEPLIVFFGISALLDVAFAAREKNRAIIFRAFAFWVITAFALLSLSADNHPARIGFIVVPLALLSGSSVSAWIERVIEEMRALGARDLLLHETPILAVAVGLVSFLSIVLAELAQRGNILTADLLVRLVGTARENAEVGGAIVALLFLTAFAATAVLAVTTLGLARAKTVGVLFALCILSVWTIRQMAMLNFPAGGGLNPQEWIVARAAAPNVRDLVADLESQSRWRANDSHTLAVAADSSLGPMLEWNLREFTNARFAQRPTAAPGVQALVLSANAPAPAGGWIAQRYRLELTRSAASMSPLRRLIFRDIGSVDSMDAAIWVPKP